MIPDETVEQVRDAADIVQVIGEHVNLKRQGTDFRGPCPFHQGTHRNFSVSPKKRMYYCFVCHEGGDVFHFLQKRLGVEWPDAVRMVGQKVGITIAEISERSDRPDPRESLWELNATAAAYFQRLLWEDPLAHDAREYLAKREISRELADQFGLGFAPREIGLMRNYMNTLGFDDTRLTGGGLLVAGEDGSEPRPRFRNRLMFPIYDLRGRNIGFGGRLLGPGEPKYLNSPETPVFSKGKILYGLNWAKPNINREERALVVEGYFDVIRLASAGIQSAVAPMGTALTEAQVALLRKVPNVFLLYDSDKAGLKATFKSGDELLKQGLSVRVVSFPSGEDPDSFAKEHGLAGVEKALNDSVDVFERKIQLLERGGWFGDLHKTRRALDRLLPTLRATSDPITRDLYLSRAGEVSGVARPVLERELGIPGPTPDATAAPIKSLGHFRDPPKAPRRDGQQRTPDSGPGLSAEKELVRAMLRDRTYVTTISEKVGPSDFWNEYFRSIYNALLVAPPTSTIEAVSASLNERAIQVIEDLLAEAEGYVYPERTISDSLARLRARTLEKELAEIERLSPLAGPEKKDELLMKKVALQNELRTTGPRTFKVF